MSTNSYTKLHVDGYEEVVRCDNNDVGFSAWIAIHSSNRGPALGGCRVWSYSNDKAALTDVLRLSKAMTYKNALARLSLGGGKAVVKADLEKVDRTRLFLEIGNFVETFKGRYITAEDVNSTVADMTLIKRQTEHVATVGASGNPSPFTAFGVYCAIKASVLYRLGSSSLSGLRITIQGLGETGGRVAELLYRDNCQIIAADINNDNIQALKSKITFRVVEPDELLTVPCEVFAPCALGGILNASTIPNLRCQIVAGSANNQLSCEADGELLHNSSILYAPDFVTNSGGVINISCEIGQIYDENRAKQLTSQISETLLEIYQIASKQQRPTNLIANELAEKLFQSPQVAL